MITFISKEPINKGWSCDSKYCVTTADGKKYLLRITPEENSENRVEMFRLQRQVAALGVSMCKPVEIGKCEEGVYQLQTWINGKDAEKVIPYLTESEQYTLGLDAGRILKAIHSIPAPDGIEEWETRFNKKIDRKIKMYQECPIHYEDGDRIIAYIENNRYLLKSRPQCFQHGDYHIGNMMIADGELVIIDFDRYDFGDPWEEFNRIVWSAQCSPLFASGIVNGYFDHEVPMDFWKLLLLYISSNLLSSLPWAIPFGEMEMNTMIDQAKEVQCWYDNMNHLIPTWWKQAGDKKIV